MNIPLYKDKTPTEPGYYLYTGSITLNKELFHVVLYPAKFEYGRDWDAYLGVANVRARSIKQFSGFFSDKLEFNLIQKHTMKQAPVIDCDCSMCEAARAAKQ